MFVGMYTSYGIWVKLERRLLLVVLLLPPPDVDGEGRSDGLLSSAGSPAVELGGALGIDE